MIALEKQSRETESGSVPCRRWAPRAATACRILRRGGGDRWRSAVRAGVGRGLAGVEAQSGRFLWGYNAIANNVCNAASPVVSGDCVFASTAYNAGSGLVKVVREGDALRAEESYSRGRQVPEPPRRHGPGGRLSLRRARPEPQRPRLHRVRHRADLLDGQGPGLRLGVGALCRWPPLFRYDRGTIFRVEANPAEFRVKGRLDPLTADGPAWSYPVVHQGQLYLRHGDLLACYDLRDSRGQWLRFGLV